MWTGQVTLSDAQVENIVKLQETGLYGSNFDEAVKNLILDALKAVRWGAK